MFLCNEPTLATEEALDNYAMMHADQMEKLTPRILLLREPSPSNKHKVAIVTGGGAGHEPFAAGF